jgi:hypothetical protein
LLGQKTKFISKQKLVEHSDSDLSDQIPAHLRNLPIPQFWKAFTLKNDTVPMLDPDTGCYKESSKA